MLLRTTDDWRTEKIIIILLKEQIIDCAMGFFLDVVKGFSLITIKINFRK